MTIHVETSLVKIFGNSVFFADKLDSLPMIFQPILFYPDWLFMTWPLELFLAVVGDGSHPYLHNVGSGAIGWAIVWYIGGVICGMFGVSRTFTDIISIELPLLVRIPFKIITYLLFWHIVIGRTIGVLLTRLTTWNNSLAVLIQRIVFAIMLIPPAIGLIISSVIVVGHFFG